MKLTEDEQPGRMFTLQLSYEELVNLFTGLAITSHWNRQESVRDINRRHGLRLPGLKENSGGRLYDSLLDALKEV